MALTATRKPEHEPPPMEPGLGDPMDFGINWGNIPNAFRGFMDRIGPSWLPHAPPGPTPPLSPPHPAVIPQTLSAPTVGGERTVQTLGQGGKENIPGQPSPNPIVNRPGFGGKGGPVPGSIRTRTPAHWDEGDPYGYHGREWNPGDRDYIAPGQERFDEKTGQYYRLKPSGTTNVAGTPTPPSRRGLMEYLLGAGTTARPSGPPQWQVESGNPLSPYKDVPREEQPQSISGERVRGRGGMAYDPETRTWEPAHPAGEGGHGGRHGGGGFGGMPNMQGMPPIFQFLLRMLMGGGGRGRQAPFGGTEGPSPGPTGGGTSDPGKPATDKLTSEIRRFFKDHPEARKWLLDNGYDLSALDEPVATGTTAGGGATARPDAVPASGAATPTGGPAAPVAAQPAAPVPAAPAPTPATAGGAPGSGIPTALSGMASGAASGATATPLGAIYNVGTGLQDLVTGAHAAEGSTTDAAGVRPAAAGVQTASLNPAAGFTEAARLSRGAIPAIGREMDGAISTRLRNFVKKEEGWRERAYGDYHQYSIGYGTKARFPSERIDREEGERRLNSELMRFQTAVNAIVPPNTPQNIRDALSSFSFNVGTAWMRRSSLADAVRAGDWHTVAARMQNYNKAGGRINSTLVRRRHREAAMLLGA